MSGTFNIALIIIICLLQSCAKEYTYENKPEVEVLPDSVIVTPLMPSCSLCNSVNNTVMKQWSFKYKNSIQCGIIDTAIITPNKTAFTFFGPSKCSLDTGLVITAYLDNIILDKDIFNYTTDHVAFYFYDHVGPTYIFYGQTPIKIFTDN